MHLFCHLLIAFLLDLRRPLVFDRLYTRLKLSFSILRKIPADILAYLSFFLFLVLHLLLLCLHGSHCCPPCGALCIRGLARRWAEGGLLGVPLLACTTVNQYTLSDNRYFCEPLPFFRSPGVVSADTDGEEPDMVSRCLPIEWFLRTEYSCDSGA